MSQIALAAVSVFTIFTLLALLDHQNAVQKSGLPNLAKVSRALVDLTTGSTNSDDIKFLESGIASCELSLKAHSDRVLNGVKDLRKIMNMLVEDENQREKLQGELTSVLKITVAACSAGPVRLSLHVNLPEDSYLPSAVYFNVDLPPESRLPVFRGNIDKSCKVTRKEQSRMIFLSNTEIEALLPQVPLEGSFFEDTASIVLSFGARDVIIHVNDSALVDLYALVSCQDSPEALQRYVFVTKDLEVGRAREVLSNITYGTDTDLARSFMVVGFLGKYFNKYA